MRKPITAFLFALVGPIVLAGCASTPVDSKTAEARFRAVSDSMDKLAVGGRVTRVKWADDGTSVAYTGNGQRVSFDLMSREVTLLDGAETEHAQSQPRIRTMPGRGRQRDREASPDGKWVAVCKDWNIVLEPQGGGDPIKVTTEGNRKFRFGSASWVYGEELDQRDAMWWSPDSKKLVFYEFDERLVPDHYLTGDMTELHTSILTEGYPKPGEPNPIANLLIYDLASGHTSRIEPAEDPDWYTYAVQVVPDGKQVLFNRTNRRQNELKVMAADMATGKTRVLLTETQPCWQDNTPTIKFLDDGHRFVWVTEKTGWKQFELRDLDGSLIRTLTHGEYPVGSVQAIDEKQGVMFYTAYSDANPKNLQLHSVNLDGSDQRRLTRESLNHSVQLSPDHKWFITTCEAIDTPPTSALYEADGTRVATIAQSDLAGLRNLELPGPELFHFTADDGATVLYGVLYKPSHFDPSRKYPLLISVYGGPGIPALPNRYTPANPGCEYGFLIAEIENRGTPNRGKAFENATYLKLGDVDIKDQVDGVKYLKHRRYVDGSRVGIYGHSYGGYMSALGILKYPDVYQAACAGGTVTDWRNYDSIYTERYMRVPQENEAGYDAGSCLTYVSQLKGHLLLLHGMVDDNVHPTNVWQLVDALQKADKPFEMMFFPNSGHGLGPSANAVRWRFFRHWLIDEAKRN